MKSWCGRVFVPSILCLVSCVLGTNDLKVDTSSAPVPVDSGDPGTPPGSDAGGGGAGGGGASGGGTDGGETGGSGGAGASGDDAASDGGGTAGDDGACVPDCTGRECGDDGCGGSCGSCGADEVCSDGVCACDPADCACGAPGWPVDPATGANVCPPYSRPAVFFSAHPGSFALGMAGGIAEHVDAGRDVFVEILTHGESSSVRTRLGDGGSCSWHSGSHNLSLGTTAFGAARVAEALDAAARLGVRGVVVSDLGDGNLTSVEVAARVNWWLGGGHSGLALKGSEGVTDVRTSGGSAHPDHAAVHAALGSSGHGDVRRYFLYHHVVGQASPDRTSDISPWSADKSNAVSAYELWSPASGRYAVERHSWEELLLAVKASPYEYIDVP
jgi:LmbE family N-acetylglucosaminyl deacetylase